MRRNRTAPAGLICCILLFAAAVLMLSGCTMKNIIDPVNDYFHRDASVAEETAPVISEDSLVAAPVRDAAGEPVVKADGEPLTVMAAYQTAVAGDLKRDSSGETVTHPNGELMTYAPGSPVLGADGEYETYAGGETALNHLGITERDAYGNPVTRAAGEVVTHGDEEIVYDTNGDAVRSKGEPETYQGGEFLRNASGEYETYPVLVMRDSAGEIVTGEDGGPVYSSIELVTDAEGEPLTEQDGEAATRQMDPQPPQKIIESPLEEGHYYIKNKSASYMFFGTPEVRAGDIPITAEEGEDPEAYAPADGDAPVRNLQFQMPGEDLSCFEIRYDPEGYAIIALEGTDQVLTAEETLRGGANVTLEDMVQVAYPQYKYRDDALYTAADNQRWVIRTESDGKYSICSAVDQHYVLTATDQWGIQNANIILWGYDGRELQKFDIDTDKQVIERFIDEGTYVISCYLTDWMLVSLGDGNYAEGTTTYLDPSNQGDGQRFRIAYDEYGYAVIYHGDSEQVLTVGSANAVNNQVVCQYAYDGGDWQKWIIEPGKHGGYNIRSKLNPYEVIDLSDGETRIGQEVHLYEDNSTLAQCWEFKTNPIPSPYAFDYMDDYAQNFSSMTDYLILINSGTNHVGVYQGSQGNWTNLYYWDCVTGKESTPTVRGEFMINVKSDSFDGNMDSPTWYTVYHCSSFFPDYFFHSIIYFYHTWMVMDASMGINASHGCVRLATENAEWIHENVPLDTKVVSY